MELYTFIYFIPMVLSAIFSLKAFTQKWPKPFKVFSIFLIISVVVEASATIWSFGIKRKWFPSYLLQYTEYNTWIYNIGLILSGIVSTYFFYCLVKSPIVRKFLLTILWLLSVLSIVNYFFIQGPHQLNSISLVPFAFITITFSTICLFQLVSDEQIVSLSRQAITWLLLGQFIYALFAIMLFLNFTFLIDRLTLFASKYLYSQDIVNIICYTFYLIGYLCKPHPKQPSTQSSYPVLS
ncbi:MAG: hypothetical protein DI535_14300 [Citrobacter freundii]|nr:MAG: hypothetical protein DI535_14300 [Citrobacter freundii]